MRGGGSEVSGAESVREISEVSWGGEDPRVVQGIESVGRAQSILRCNVLS